MKKIIYLGVFLGIISSIVTIALAAVNQITAPVIEQNQNLNLQMSLVKIFPHATSFEVIATEEDLEAPILEVTKAFDSNGDLLGFIYKQEIMGYVDRVRYLIGIDINGYYTNFIVLYSMETPGFGTRIETDEWIDRVMGVHATERIDVLTNATITTAPIIRAMNLVYDNFVSHMEMEEE